MWHAARPLSYSLAISLFATVGAAEANGFKVLYAFDGKSGGRPYAGLIEDIAGNLYGTTAGGGALKHGTVFKRTPAGVETVLYSFAGGTDGASPQGVLLADAAGDFFGTTSRGGAHNGGTVFELKADGTKLILYSFGASGDGAVPIAGLIADAAGNFYGTTSRGGTYNEGTAFEFTVNGSESILHSFGAANDGARPVGRLMLDAGGNLYGTTLAGGSGAGNFPAGNGTVFKIATDGTESIVHSFNGTDGQYPEGDVIEDQAGNLYGTTPSGGNGGIIFEMAPDGTETILFTPRNLSDGIYPSSALVRDASGNLYGTMYRGGNFGCYDALGCGVVFQLASDLTYTVLTRLDGSNGGNPVGDLLMDKRGHLFGTTTAGGAHNHGAVFEQKVP